jgi:hypothetical protein
MPRRWAISVLQESSVIRECEEHGWMQDRADPQARKRALELARQDPPARIFPEQTLGRVSISPVGPNSNGSCGMSVAYPACGARWIRRCPGRRGNRSPT